MRSPTLLLGIAVAVTASISPACSCDDGGDTPTDAGTTDAPADGGVDIPPPDVFADVTETAQHATPGLSAPVFVVYTESNVPHIYAENREDLYRVEGFVVARDRFFMMDMARRLAQGTTSAFLGQDALSTDLESRTTGMSVVAARSFERLTDEQRTLFGAFAAGVNDYIEAVRARRVAPPREYEIAAPVFGARSPAEMMEPFELEDVTALLTAVTYNLGYETGDVRREEAARALEAGDLYSGEDFADLRLAAAWDTYGRVTNANGYHSASIWGLETTGSTALFPIVDPRGHTRDHDTDAARRAPIPRDMLSHLADALDRFQERLGRTHEEGFGSNAWAVGGSLTTDGAAILEGDGHLGGTVPTLFYRIGLDTKLLGDGDTRQTGLVFPGLPIMAVGTNGEVAWSQTQFFGDITDWYREEITLDASGAPATATFMGMERPLVRVDEEYVVADIEALESVGRTETWPRWETFDGRMLTRIEGRSVDADTAPGAGETVVAVLGGFVIPGDEDGDGTITAISFDYTGLEGPNYALTVDAWGHAGSVREMYDTQQALVAYSQNIAAADSSGSVMFTPYQVMPCRAHLARETDGSWSPGAHPGRLLDGTRFGGFDLPLTPEGRVDEAAGTEPHNCVVPLAEYPAAIDPAESFVVTANNDPGTMTEDNSLTNDPWYIGGPWHEDYRATRIAEMIRAEAGTIDEDAVARMQADVRSPLGAQLVPLILEAIEAARTAAAGTPPAGSAEERMAAAWTARQADYEEFERRLIAWRDGGFRADAGVETFYHPTVTAEERENAVATILFNAWLGPFDQKTLGDERLPNGTYAPTGGAGRMRMLTRMIAGRGAANPLADPAWNPATEEHVFFDVLGTAEVETSQEITLAAIDEALAFLRSEPTEPGHGGFGNDDWDSWIWGLRHHVRFDSLIADFIDASDATFGFLVDMFSIAPGDDIPIADDLPDGDPRADLPGFPRPGDNFVVDAANNGFGGTRFTYGSIPVFRMVIALRGDATTGRNILPAGQSGVPASDYFDDQARLWLGNETTPMRFAPEDVAAGAMSRETFYPAR